MIAWLVAAVLGCHDADRRVLVETQQSVMFSDDAWDEPVLPFDEP
jgi:hypothetical protein